MKRTKARLKINQILTGKKTNLRVVGCLLFREWDKKDKRFYYWEEWEITGLADYDSWVEYDHSDQTVSLYEPIRFTQTIDPTQLKRVNHSPFPSRMARITLWWLTRLELVKL